MIIIFFSVEEILADSESELEDLEETNDAPKSKKKQLRTWIQEDSGSIVDLTDPNTSSKITGR